MVRLSGDRSFVVADVPGPDQGRQPGPRPRATSSCATSSGPRCWCTWWTCRARRAAIRSRTSTRFARSCGSSTRQVFAKPQLTVASKTRRARRARAARAAGGARHVAGPALHADLGGDRRRAAGAARSAVADHRSAPRPKRPRATCPMPARTGPTMDPTCSVRRCARAHDAEPQRLGILGGTLDPVHFGHLDAAEAARQALALDEVWFVPSHDPPHRPLDPLASPFHRFAMVSLVAAEHPAYRASDIELRRAGPSYTIDTLKELHAPGLAAGAAFLHHRRGRICRRGLVARLSRPCSRRRTSS